MANKTVTKKIIKAAEPGKYKVYHVTPNNDGADWEVRELGKEEKPIKIFKVRRDALKFAKDNYVGQPDARVYFHNSEGKIMSVELETDIEVLDVQEEKKMAAKKEAAKKKAEEEAKKKAAKKETTKKVEVKKVEKKVESKKAEKKVEPKKAEKKVETKKVEVKKAETKKAEKKIEVKVEAKAGPGKYKTKDNYTPRLKTKFTKEVIPTLMKQFKYKSVMAVPHIEKIVINIGLGDAVSDKKVIDASTKELALITGQHPVVTKAKKSIATFKLRQGEPIGCKVTLRGNRMYEFFDKLVSIALPRVRDFRGVSSRSFDGNGNYTLGIKEQLIFPEIDYDKVSKVRGMDIVIVTTARTNDEAKALLDLMGMPFHR